MCVSVLPIDVCTMYMPGAFKSQKKTIKSPGTRVNRQLWATMWKLEIKSTCSIRAISGLNHRALFPTPY